MIAAKSGAACGVQLLKEPGHRVARSQGTLRFIPPDNTFPEDLNCLGLAGSTLVFMANLGRDWRLSTYRLKSPSLPAVVRDRAESYAWFMIGCHESRQAEAVVKQHSAPHSRKSGSGIS